MKKALTALSLILTLVLTADAQKTLRHQKVTWVGKPQIHAIDSAYLDESAVVIQDYRYIQSVLTYPYSTYYTIHRIIKVMSDAGIEKFNKVYVPLYNNESLIDVRVRTISEDGAVKNFDERNLKQLSNPDGFRNYKIFAVEGAVKGSEIEYIYTIKQSIKSYDREVIQRDVPILDAYIEMLAPKGYEYKTRCYNGLPATKHLYDKWIVEAKNIPAMSDEGYSSYRSKLMRMDYKIRSTSYSAVDNFTWKKISENLFETLYRNKGAAQASKLIKSIRKEGQSELDELIAVEKYFKQNVTIKNSGNEEYRMANLVLKNKVGNRIGVARAYIKALEYMDAKFDIIMTCSRFEGEIDESFATSLDLREVLFYFPKYDKYISPFSRHLRLGPAPDVLQGNTGLFIHTSIGESGYLRYKGQSTKQINVLAPEYNNMGMNAEISLTADVDAAELSLERFVQGQQAFSLRSFYDNAKTDRLDDFQNQVLVSDIEDAQISEFRVENENMDLSADPEEYFRVFGKVKSESMVQQAGQDILLSIGKVIGKQMELYEEKNRTNDVIFYSYKRYLHTITFNIPEGYECTGLDQLDHQYIVEKEGDTLMQFISTYRQEGNKLTIEVVEDYNVLELDNTMYSDYREVVNSAANFNKIVLVLVPADAN